MKDSGNPTPDVILTGEAALALLDEKIPYHG